MLQTRDWRLGYSFWQILCTSQLKLYMSPFNKLFEIYLPVPFKKLNCLGPLGYDGHLSLLHCKVLRKYSPQVSGITAVLM